MYGIRNDNYRQCIRLCTFHSIETKLYLLTEKADSLLGRIKLLLIKILIICKIEVCRDRPNDLPCVYYPCFQNQALVTTKKTYVLLFKTKSVVKLTNYDRLRCNANGHS
jgi:hypothetical protein